MATTESAVLSAPERNHYFYGKLLTVAELEKEQRYFLEQRRRLHRLTLGRGVVCGLDLAVDAGDRVAILPGLAIDGRGREIVVPETVSFDPRQPTDGMGQPAGDPLESGTVEICLAYAERCADLAPVLVPECELDDDGERCSPSTVLESFRVLVREAQGDPPPPPACDSQVPSAASELHEFICRQLAEADCSAVPEDPCVSLGRVSLDPVEVDPCAGRELVYAPRLLFDLVLCLAERVEQLEADGQGLRADAGAETAWTFRAVAGNAQSAPSGSRLPDYPTVELARGGRPVQEARLEVEVIAGGGKVGKRTLRTGKDGQARTYWQLGPELGEQRIAVRVADSDSTDLAVSFRATAVEPEASRKLGRSRP